MNFVEVALSTPLRSTFTYKNTENLSLIGKRVIVEFGRRQLIGVVIDENVRVKKDIKVKNIEEVLDYEPVLSPHTISRAKIISDYYFHPIGEVIFTFLPTLLRKKKKLVDLDKYKNCLLYTSPSPRDCQ